MQARKKIKNGAILFFVKIVFTKHAVEKMKLLKKHKFKITDNEVRKTILEPENIDLLSDVPRTIVSTSISESHILRVAYRKEDDIITVNTFYPARKGRYYEN